MISTTTIQRNELGDTAVAQAAMLRERANVVCGHADDVLALLAEIRALACSHAGACSGQLRRAANGGYEAWLICDACGEAVRELAQPSC